MLKPVRVSAPAEGPVTLAAAKAFLNVDHSDDDALIQALVNAAVEELDGYSGTLGRALVTQTWRQELPCFQRRMRLALVPFQSVTSIAYQDSDDVQQTASALLYDAFEDHLGGYVELKPTASWPSTYPRPDAVTVTYTVGYGTAAEVPEPIKTAIKLAVSDLYDRRVAYSEAGQIFANPIYQQLLAPYRHWSF